MTNDIRCQFCGYVPCGCLEIEEEIIELTEEVTDENSEKVQQESRSTKEV